MHGHEADEFVTFVTTAERFVEIYMAEGIDREWAEICAGRYMVASSVSGYMSEDGVHLDAKRELAAGKEEEEAWKQVAAVAARREESGNG